MSASSRFWAKIKPLRMAWLLAALLVACAWQRAADDLDLELEPEKADAGANKLQAQTGGVLFRFADAKQPAKDLGECLFWRVLPDRVAASITPLRLEMDGSDVIAPILNPNPPPGQQEYLYPHSGRAKVEQGEHTLTPFNLTFRLEGKDFKSDHPALKFGRDEVIIRCAPVRFEIADENGAPAAAAIAVSIGKEQLLREAKAFSLVVAWLPVGLSYDSTAGKFRLDAEGKFEAPAAGLAKNAVATDSGFRLTVRATAPKPRRPVKRGAGVGKVGTWEKGRFFVTPSLVKPGAKIYLALPKSALAGACEDAHCFIDITRPLDFFYDLAWEKAAAPAPAEEQAAAEAIGEKDLIWLAIAAPADYLGVLPFAVQFKKQHTLRHKV
ncbi:MAG: hypothetical protein N3A66_10765, partial [Planctomycetota bacterium]|nr:hypothetical protein [Planctomycetota bacterium]